MFRRLGPSSVVILGGGRTPIGSLFGALHAVPASRLAAAAAAAALQRAGAAPQEVGLCVLGQALAAGQGAAPHRHAMLVAGIPPSADVFRVEKGCASGLKAVSLAASSLGLGQTGLALAVGCESLSACPLLLQRARAEKDRLGDELLKDSLLSDALTDAHSNLHLGFLADAVAARFGIARAACDEFAVLSHKRARDAASEGLLLKEGLTPVPVDPNSSIRGVTPHPNAHPLQQQKQQQLQSRALLLKEDEELRGALQLDRVASLRASFSAGGVTTAANGVLSVADAACEPVSFPLAAEEACRRALRLAGLETASVDLFEVVELAAVVPLLLLQRLRLCHTRLNVLGGALCLGHPFGMSGVRALLTLLTALHSRDLQYGCAAACNGGGGATAVVLEAL
ncbi:hypothetical protein Esti_003358 [Eimeria stiedai]